jgi:hypothetical protein
MTTFEVHIDGWPQPPRPRWVAEVGGETHTVELHDFGTWQGVSREFLLDGVPHKLRGSFGSSQRRASFQFGDRAATLTQGAVRQSSGRVFSRWLWVHTLTVADEDFGSFVGDPKTGVGLSPWGYIAKGGRIPDDVRWADPQKR